MAFLLKRRWLLAAAVLASISAMLVAGSVATAGKKPRTKVDLRIDEERDGSDRFVVYKVTISKPKECKKKRRVVIVHDENGNGRKDKGEFVIARGRTNRKGRFNPETEIAPPRGDKVLVIVKKNRKCKGGRTSQVF